MGYSAAMVVRSGKVGMVVTAAMVATAGTATRTVTTITTAKATGSQPPQFNDILLISSLNTAVSVGRSRNF